jgi:hypothetical protein
LWRSLGKSSDCANQSSQHRTRLTKWATCPLTACEFGFSLKQKKKKKV